MIYVLCKIITTFINCLKILYLTFKNIDKMVRHIVMIKINNNLDKETVTHELKLMLERLQLSVDTLIKIEIGINISKKNTAFDMVLSADFDNEKGLDEYRVHPEHVKVLDFLTNVMEKAVVVDYNK